MIIVLDFFFSLADYLSMKTSLYDELYTINLIVLSPTKNYE